MDENKFVITNKGVLKEYHGDDEVLQIPDGVKVIGKDIIGYRSGKNVRKVVIPEGVVKIMERAFSSSDISEVVLPNTLRIIGKDAFGNCENLKNIIIPDGVTIIPDSAFCFSGLEKITLPDSVEEIRNSAFLHCRKLKKINFSNLETVKIGTQAFTGCEALVDKNGLLIIQNRVFTYHSEAKNAYVVIPDGVTEIELGAFDHCGKIHLEMSLNCPSWIQTGAAKMYGFARSLLACTGSSITFRDEAGKKVAYIVLSNEDETEPKKYGAVLSIKSEDGKFDFTGYDAYFASLAKVPNKIQVAIARVEYPYELSDEMLDVYQSFLKKQAVAVGTMLIDDDRIETLEMLGKKQLFTANAVAKLIDYAKSKNKVAFTAWLLEYNNTTFGKSVAKKTKVVASLPKAFPITSNSKQEKSVADWRKIYKFKYKDGGVIITGYLGSEECVTLPEKIGEKYVIGLGRGAFERMGQSKYSKNTTTRKIIIPSTIVSIESGAIGIVDNIEIEIQEGIKELPKWAIDIVKNITVKLPVSLESIGEQFGHSVTETIKMIVPENSCAEEFCKKYSLSYTTYVPVVSPDDGKAEVIKEQMAITKKQAASKNAENPWKKPKAGTNLLPRYMGQEKVVEFPLKVDGIKITGIANTSGDTPDNYKAITAVVIPEGYTYIGNKAFAGCENLETIELPLTLKEVGTQAFADCKKLREIVIKKDITFVGKNVFSGANIGTVIIETEKKTKIPSHLFFGCHIERLIVVGGPFKSNGNVFDYTGVSAGTAFADKMYEGNFPVEVYLNDDFSTLDLKGTGGSNAKKIHSLAELDESVVINSIFKNLIAEEKKKTGKVANNSGKVVEAIAVDSIDCSNSTFVLSGFDTSEDIEVAGEIKQRGGEIKDSVSGKVNYVVVPDRDITKTSKVKKAMELQEKGKSIAIIRLEECRKHLRIHDEKVFGSEGAKIAAEYRLSLVDGKITLLKYFGNDEDVVVPEKMGDYPVVSIGKHCFSESFFSKHKSKIKRVTIPATITVLTGNIFDYCEELKTVDLPEGLLRIERWAFNQCTKLENITIPKTVTTIADSAFNHCKGLKKIFIPAGVHTMESAFIGCDELEEIIVDTANEKYDSRDNCNAVIETATNTLIFGCKTTVIPNTVIKIGDAAFCGLDTIDEFVVPDGIVEIGANAFNGCMKLKAVSLPESLVKIGGYAFHFCRELVKVELPNSLQEIGDNVFGNCDKLAEITIPEGLHSVDGYFLYNCKIKKVYGKKTSLAQRIAERWRAEYVEIS